MSDTVYVDNSPAACEWLRNLTAAGHLRGEIWERDVRSLAAHELTGRQRVHTFAGIGAWEYALALAGWPAELPVWTGSCPCQPFSDAGPRRGFDDPRHLWPAWRRLIVECRPPVVLGEQVASGVARKWLDVVSADLEDAGYAVGAANLCAAGVGAPHRRQRLYFAAVAPRGVEHTARQRQPPFVANRTTGSTAEPASVLGGQHWRDVEWIASTEGVLRPAKPGTSPVVNGASGRVVAVRADGSEHWYSRSAALECIGNAIVPQVAAAFARVVLESLDALV